MKQIELLLMLILAIFLNACALDVVGAPSLNSICTIENTIVQSGVEGVWYDTEDSAQIIIELLDENNYSLTINFEGASSNSLATRLVAIKG